jgi:hypothetical protein
MKKLILLLMFALTGPVGIARAQTPPAGTPGAPAPVSPERQACTDAMNKDPAFAKSIIATVDKQIDQKTIDAHTRANDDIAENQKHVIMAYAAMWIIAALFVVFLWRRQQALKLEIAQLRKDLDAAEKR